MNVPLPLAPSFLAPDAWRSKAGDHYVLLPMRFLRLDPQRYILTNFVGEYVVVAASDLNALVAHQLEMHGPVYNQLKSKHFVLDGDSNAALDLLACKYRTKQSLLPRMTSLFLFVVTLRCEHSCPYCQVSRRSHDRRAFDMSRETAARAIEQVFDSPSPTLKIEFQGGEPLLNFDLIACIVEQVEERNRSAQREIAFVIATNLALITDEMLEFCRQHRIAISTSLDGPRDLHNANRPRPGGDSHERAVSGIVRARDVLGEDQVSALMTTTAASLEMPEAIVDEYVRLGFKSIFLRALSPFGFAIKTGAASSYHVEDWLEFYRRGLQHIIRLNRSGSGIREEYASLLLRKMLTPWPTTYVDLQSPAGIGISCLAYNYDGGVYASDEARMLAEMRDQTFRLGHVNSHSYAECVSSLIDTLGATMTEVMPMCADCGAQPWCGSDPVFHHATQADAVGRKPASAFCRRNMEVIRLLVRLIEDDPESAEVLQSWIS